MDVNIEMLTFLSFIRYIFIKLLNLSMIYCSNALKIDASSEIFINDYSHSIKKGLERCHIVEIRMKNL